MTRFILNKPVITEQSYKDASRGVFTFDVYPGAGKPQIKSTIEAVYGVHVTAISTNIRRGKVKSAGRKRLHIVRPDAKRARVQLKKGEKIDAFTAGGTS